MKKRTKFIGGLTLILLLAGYLMKLTHLQGADMMWSLGIFIGAFAFTWFSFMDRLSYEKTMSFKMRGFIGFLGSCLTLLGLGLKVLNWSLANHFIAIGAFLLLIYFIVNNSINNSDKKT